MSLRKRRLAAAIVISVIVKRRKRRKRTCWVKEWMAKRKEFGAYAQLLVELRSNDSQYYKNFIRMSACDFDFLLNKVTPRIKRQDTLMRCAISPGERLALTLKFLASGESYHSLMYLFRIPVSTIATIIPECCQVIFEVLKEDYLKMPNSTTEWLDISEQYYKKWNFPNCIGALDGKHVVIQAPHNSGSHYFNYKGTHSIVLMALVDAEYKFTYIDVGCNGRVSDGGAYTNCSLSTLLEENRLNIPPERPLPGRNKPMPFVIVADDAFAMKSYMMKPYSFRNQPGPNRVFNYRLSRARRVVENAFGHIANRFRILRKPIELNPEKARSIVSAICILHNFLLTRNSSKQIYAPQGSFDIENEGKIEYGNWRQDGILSANLVSLQAIPSRNFSEYCKEIKTELTEYFCSPEGELPWQYRYIKNNCQMYYLFRNNLK